MIFTLFTSLLATLAVSSVSASEGVGSATEPGAHLEYAYNGMSGPLFWDKINPTCGGKIQSPINIEPFNDDFAVHLRGVLRNPNGLFPAISWTNAPGVLKNLGDTFKFIPTNASTSTFDRTTNGGGVFNLIQWHFHAPSEHRLNGIDYPAEFHFVHQEPHSGALAVVGGWVDFAETTSPFVQAVITAGEHLALHGQTAFTPDYAATVSAIKNSARFYRYTGSLTTPPCLEGVKWLVAGKPIFTITPEHWDILKEMQIFNARDTQVLADPYDGAWATKRMSDYFPEGEDSAPAPVAAAHH